MNKKDLDFSTSISKIKNRVSVKDYYFKELPKELYGMAFTVSNLESLSQINIIMQSLDNAQKEGLSFYEWKSQLDQDAVRKLSSARLETVYRTNMATAYSQSTRYNAATSGVLPYMMFSAVGDQRSRPSHMELDGIIKKADSDFWNKYQTPLGYNCRCRMIPLSKAEAERRGISKKSLNNLPEPDEGFGYQNIGDVSSGTQKRVQEAIDSLPPTSPYRSRLQQAQNNNQALIDTWYEKNKDIFNKGF